MALTDEQIAAINTLIQAIDEEMKTISKARENARAVMRIDTIAPDAVPDDMVLIQAIKARALIAANNLVNVLS